MMGLFRTEISWPPVPSFWEKIAVLIYSLTEEAKGNVFWDHNLYGVSLVALWPYFFLLLASPKVMLVPSYWPLYASYQALAHIAE